MNDSDWIGPIGDVWATQWRRTDRTFAGLTPHLLATIDAASSNRVETVVDLGCGAGGTAIAVADAMPQARVHGIDLSPSLIAIARERARGHANVSFVAADAVSGADRYRADLYMSRHGVMFFADPVAAFTRFGKAAAPDARIVFSCFAARDDNAWAVETAAAVGAGIVAAGTAPGPFAFADEKHVAQILIDGGWRDARRERIDFSYVAGAGVDPVADAVDFLTRIGPAAAALRAASVDDRATGIANLTAVCKRYRNGAVVEFPASAWIWTARTAAAT